MSEQQRASVYRATGSNHKQHFRRTARVVALAAAGAVLGMASAASAADVQWIGAPGTPLPFEDGANWEGGSVPTESTAIVNNGGSVTISTFTGDVFDLKLGVGIANGTPPPT